MHEGIPFFLALKATSCFLQFLFDLCDSFCVSAMTSANEAVFTAKDIASILPLLQQKREQTQLQHVDGISSGDAKLVVTRSQ